MYISVCECMCACDYILYAAAVENNGIVGAFERPEGPIGTYTTYMFAGWLGMPYLSLVGVCERARAYRRQGDATTRQFGAFR